MNAFQKFHSWKWLNSHESHAMDMMNISPKSSDENRSTVIKIISWKPFQYHHNHGMNLMITTDTPSFHLRYLLTQVGLLPLVDSPSKNPYQNSTGESRQGFTRDLRGSEGSPWGFRKEWMRVPGDFEGSGGESLGISKGVEGSPWGFWREWRRVPWELEGSKGKSLGI
jgi:hypothetical protein